MESDTLFWSSILFDLEKTLKMVLESFSNLFLSPEVLSVGIIFFLGYLLFKLCPFKF